MEDHTLHCCLIHQSTVRRERLPMNLNSGVVMAVPPLKEKQTVIYFPISNARVMLPLPGKDDFIILMNGREIPVIVEGGSVLVDNLNAGRYLMEIR